MYWYVLFGGVTKQPPGNWTEVKAPVPAFQGASEVVLTPNISRFEVSNAVQPHLINLPLRTYSVQMLAPGVKVFLEEGRLLTIQSNVLSREALIVQWLQRQST